MAAASIGSIDAAFSLSLKTPPGEAFEYKPDPQLLVYLIEKITGRPFVAYIRQELFQPLGIQTYEWDTGMATIQDMKMPLYELAKLGKLYLAQGKWDGNQLIPQPYFTDSITAHVEKGFPEQADYGYLWWVSEIEDNPAFFSSGFGGQYLIVVPGKSLVVTIASRMDRPHPENKIIVRNLLRNEFK